MMFNSHICSNPNARDFIRTHLTRIYLDHGRLSANPNMVDFFEWQPEWIEWDFMCKNPNAKELIFAKDLDHDLPRSLLEYLAENPNPDVIRLVIDKLEEYDHEYSVYSMSAFRNLSRNEHAFPLIHWERHFDKIDWLYMSKNPAAIELLEANREQIYWSFLSENPAALPLLEANPHKIDWESLSGNPAAIHLLEANQDKIDWDVLSGNPAAIHLLEANQDKIDWEMLSGNPAAIHLLEANLHIVDFFALAANPAIFETYDYEGMKATRAKIIPAEELAKIVYHPTRVARHIDTYSYDLGEDQYDSDTEPSMKRTKA
jgi:hypothetical protein